MGDISAWCDKSKVEAAFRRGVKTGAASSGNGEEATLSALKKVIPKENYDEIQISFAAFARDKKYLALKTFTSKDFFIKMCKGSEAKAEKLAKKMEADEDAAAAKDGAPKAKGSDVTSRLTDASKYTGAHKERFDESGKGKGLAGREDVSKNDGYVGNYKGEGTYKG